MNLVLSALASRPVKCVHMLTPTQAPQNLLTETYSGKNDFLFLLSLFLFPVCDGRTGMMWWEGGRCPPRTVLFAVVFHLLDVLWGYLNINATL